MSRSLGFDQQKEASKVVASGKGSGDGASSAGKGTPGAAASSSQPPLPSVPTAAAKDSARSLMATLHATDRFLVGLIHGTKRLWAACEAVSLYSL